jgi:hypothetical protein
MTDLTVEGEKTGDGTNSNKCTGPRKLQSHKKVSEYRRLPSRRIVLLYLAQGSPNYGPRANTGPRTPPIRPATAGRTYPVSGPHCKIYCQKRKKSHQHIYATDQSLSDDAF